MDLLSFTRDLAIQAGKITLEYYNSPKLTIISKADSSPVTQGDRLAEEFLRREIKKQFPSDGIIGEEYGTEEGTSGRKWIMDPIDGTKTFIHGVPLYGTLLALEEEGEITHGAIVMPALNEYVVAAKGRGCFWNDRPCKVSSTATLAESTFVTTDDIRFRNRLGHEHYQRLCNSVKLYRNWGDCYGYLLVATGRADLMIDAKITVWDIAPMAIIATEAGGRYTTFSGEATHYGNDFVMSNGLIHQEVLDMLNDR